MWATSLTAGSPSRQAELVDLLDAERAYYEARVAPLAKLRATLAAEMTARVPDSSASAPWRSGDFTYREIHTGGAEFPTVARRRDEGRDESVIDLQAVADANPGAEFHRGECEVSPDGDGVGLVIRRRRRRAVPPAIPRPGHRHGPAGHRRVDVSHRRVERGLDDLSVSAHRRRQSPVSGVGTCARHRCRDGPTGLRRTRRTVRSQPGRHPLGCLVRRHRVVAQHDRSPRAVVRRAWRTTDSRAYPTGSRRVLRRARARSRRRPLPHRHEPRR